MSVYLLLSQKYFLSFYYPYNYCCYYNCMDYCCFHLIYDSVKKNR